jgi:hypothetical protein
MKTFIPALLGLCVLLTNGTAANAQQPITNPPITPWLNLYRPGGSAAFNYNNLVHPEFDFRSSILAVQQQSRTNQQAITDYQTTTAPLVTGHLAGFMTQNNYFQTMRTGGLGGAGTNYGTTTQPTRTGTSLGSGMTTPR